MKNNIVNFPTTLTNKIEHNKIRWMLYNAIHSGNAYEKLRLSTHPEYQPIDWIKEAMFWARGEDYFPNMSNSERLLIFRKYPEWNKFEMEVMDLCAA